MALATGDLAAAPIDPRGTFVTVNDGVADVLGGWLYGPIELDPSRAKAKEVTDLVPDALAAPTGTSSRAVWRCWSAACPDGAFARVLG